MPLQVLLQAQVRHAGDEDTDQHLDIVSGCTQHLRGALKGELRRCPPQAHHNSQTDGDKIYEGPLQASCQAPSGPSSNSWMLSEKVHWSQEIACVTVEQHQHHLLLTQMMNLEEI